MKRIMMSLVVGSLVVAGPAALAKPAKAFKNKEDNVSYALGVELGEAFKSQSLEVRPDKLAEGMKDVLQGKTLRLERDEVNKILVEFRQQQIAKQEQKIKEISQENADLGKKYMEKNKSESNVKITDSGLQYRVLEAGKGKKPAATDTVTVNYEGKFIDGEIFDSSYKRGQPASFKLNQVIAGWTEGLQLMQEGSTWEFVIPPELAYGENGMGGVIGPNETLVFKVELIKVN